MVVGYFMTFYEYVLYQIHFSAAHTHSHSDNKIQAKLTFSLFVLCVHSLYYIFSAGNCFAFSRKNSLSLNHILLGDYDIIP